MNYKQKIRGLRLLSHVITAISTILLFLAFAFDFDVDNGYFEYGAPSVAFIALYALGFIPAILCFFTKKKEQVVKELPSQDENKNSLALIGTLLILAGVCEILFDKTAHETVAMLIGMGICGFGVYYLMLAVKAKFDLTVAKLFALLLGACMPVGMILGNNSNYHRHINSVENTLSAIFAVCVLLYILYEGNFVAKKTYRGAYHPSLLTALHTGTVISTSYICAHLLDILTEEARFYQMLLSLALCIAIKIRLGDIARSTDAKTDEEWLEIENPPEPVEEVETAEEVEAEENTEIEEQKETDE